MDDGFVVEHGHYNASNLPFWVEGEIKISFWSGIKTSDGRRTKIIDKVSRCDDCGYLEFYATRTSID